jgi:hypothetical protein
LGGGGGTLISIANPDFFFVTSFTLFAKLVVDPFPFPFLIARKEDALPFVRRTFRSFFDGGGVSVSWERVKRPLRNRERDDEDDFRDSMNGDGGGARGSGMPAAEDKMFA